MAPNGDGEAVLRGFAQALESADLEKAVGYFSTDAVYVTPYGEFRGTTEVRRYLRWMFDTNSGLKIEPTGIGILAVGNRAVYEHNVSATFRGKKWKLPMLCTYELSEGRIRRLVTLFDRLALAKQVGAGWMAQRTVAAVIKASEKGLR